MTTYTSTLEPSMVKNLRFGLESKNKLSKKDYRFGLKNKCVPGSSADEICDDNDVKPVDPIIEHSGDCYTAIQTEANKTNTLSNYTDVNTCIQNLNSKLKCDGSSNTSDDYLRCPSEWNKKNNTDNIKPTCQTEDNALKNIINYCINQTDNPDKSSNDLCNNVYETNQFRNVNDSETLDQLNKSKYTCGDTCNLQNIKVPEIKKYKYNNTLDKSNDNMNCHEMSKLIFDCEQLSKEDNGKDFKDLYNKFVKNGKYDFDKDFDNKDKKELNRLLKYGMCKIAADNIDIVTGAKIEHSLTDWWYYNIFNKASYSDVDEPSKKHESGFQRNIFYISFFIVLFLKLTILSKFNIMPGTTTYLNKALPLLSIVLSLIIFYAFINRLDIISSISRISFMLFVFSIILGIGFYIKDKIWAKDNSSKQVLSLLIVIGLIILFTKSLIGISDNNLFISVSILLYFIFISIFFILKSEKSTMIFKMLSILMICLLLIVYLFYSKDLIFNTIYFYVFIFIILIFIICANNTDLFYKKFNGSNSSKYVKLINVVLRPFRKNEGLTKYLVLGCYFIFALADSFISVLSPQMSLVIMIVFRLLLNRWYEPINAVFASLSGYSMSNIEGTHESMTTTNKGILDVDNLLSFFVK